MTTEDKLAKFQEALSLIATCPPEAVAMCPSIAQAILAEVEKP